MTLEYSLASFSEEAKKTCDSNQGCLFHSKDKDKAKSKSFDEFNDLIKKTNPYTLKKTALSKVGIHLGPDIQPRPSSFHEDVSSKIEGMPPNTRSCAYSIAAKRARSLAYWSNDVANLKETGSLLESPNLQLSDVFSDRAGDFLKVEKSLKNRNQSE